MSNPPLTPAGLRCAHQADPLGVAPDRVRLSWRLEGTGGSRAQRAYRILVTINVWGDYLWPTIVIQDPHRTTISAGVQQFVSSFGLNVSSGGSVFAAFVIATVPMFVLVGFTMRYFVAGLTEGATKL